MDVDADLSSNDESVISNGSSIVKRQSGSFNHPQSHSMCSKLICGKKQPYMIIMPLLLFDKESRSTQPT